MLAETISGLNFSVLFFFYNCEFGYYVGILSGMVCVHPISLFIQRIAAASVGQPAYLWKRMLPYLIFSSSLARFTKYLRLGIKDFFLWKKMLYLTPIKDVYQVIGGFLFHPEKAVASQGQNWNHPEIICEPCFGCMPKVLQYPTFNVQVNFKFCF